MRQQEQHFLCAFLWRGQPLPGSGMLWLLWQGTSLTPLSPQAALIMQVLQLTADQIAMLPPEQRQSILILKEQIQKSTGAP